MRDPDRLLSQAADALHRELDSYGAPDIANRLRRVKRRARARRFVVGVGSIAVVALTVLGGAALVRSMDNTDVKPAEETNVEGSRKGAWKVVPKVPDAYGYQPEGLFAVPSGVVVVSGSEIFHWDSKKPHWSTLIEIPQADECDGCGYGESVVWADDKLLLWGGGFVYRFEKDQSAGASFDPETRQLKPLPTAPIEARWWHTAVWSGSEMLIWGGTDGEHELGDGAAYNPSTKEWRLIPSGPMGGYGHSAVWTGTEMIVWGGSGDYESEGTRGFPTTFIGTGAAYNPTTNEWRSLPEAPIAPRAWHSAVWTGRQIIVWGGTDGGEFQDGARYEPETDSWEMLPEAPISGRVDHSAVWTGDAMVVWGGGPTGGTHPVGDGAAYWPREAMWTRLAAAPIKPRARHDAVWTGEAMFVWGGCCNAAEHALTDGALWRDGLESR